MIYFCLVAWKVNYEGHENITQIWEKIYIYTYIHFFIFQYKYVRISSFFPEDTDS